MSLSFSAQLSCSALTGPCPAQRRHGPLSRTSALSGGRPAGGVMPRNSSASSRAERCSITADKQPPARSIALWAAVGHMALLSAAATPRESLQRMCWEFECGSGACSQGRGS